MLPAEGALLEDGQCQGGRRVLELAGLEQARMCFLRSLLQGLADKDGVAPCQVAESLTQGGADAEVGPETGQGAQHVERSKCTTLSTDRADSPLEKLMLSLGCMSGNLLAGDTRAGQSAGVAGVSVRCLG